MMYIESALKRFLLLSSLAFVATQPSFAYTGVQAADMAGNASQSSEKGLMVSVAKTKHRFSMHHTKPADAEEAFTNNFSVPFLPAISN